MKSLLSAWCLLFLIFAPLLNLGFVMSHEAAHDQINIYHGCLDSRITYFTLAGPQTTCYSWGVGSDRESAFAWHSLNEIVGYNVIWLVNTLLFAVFLFGSLYSVRGER